MTPGLGIKVAKPGYNLKSIKEFTILKGIEDCGRVPQVYACGMVSYINPDTRERSRGQYILMEHLDGITAESKLHSIINKYYPGHYKYIEQAEGWAWDSVYFKDDRIHYTYLMNRMSSYGLEMCDHESNLANFIIRPNGVWYVIDFSCEDIPAIHRKSMMELAAPYLSATLPPVKFLEVLRDSGFIV